MKLSFCPTCNRVVLKGFIYCPYCGISLTIGSGIGQDMEMPFKRLERLQDESRIKQIDELITRLDGIECDVELVLNGADDHG